MKIKIEITPEDGYKKILEKTVDSYADFNEFEEDVLIGLELAKDYLFINDKASTAEKAK